MLRLLSTTALYSGLALLAVFALSGLIALVYGDLTMFQVACGCLAAGLCSLVFSSVCEDHI